MTKKLSDLGLLILRVSFSVLMLTHGVPKLSKLFVSPIAFPDPLGVGSGLSLILALIGELIAPIFIMIGFKTKIAAIPATITMFVAAFVVHFGDPIDTKEKALLYFFTFLVILLSGAGKFSVDGYLDNKKD
jgi:putative oxidoreductase